MSAQVMSEGATATNIDEILRLGRESIQAQSELEALLHHAADAMIVFDEHGFVKSFNRAAERLFHCQEIEYLGRSCATLFERDNECGEDVRALLRSWNADGKDPLHNPLYARDSRGEALPLAVTMGEVAGNDLTLFDDSGTVLDMEGQGISMCIIRDLRPELKAREELESVNEALNLATNIKDEFLARVSHELRTPLNAVLGIGKLMQGESLTEAQQSYMSELVAAGENLHGIIENILDFSRHITSEEGALNSAEEILDSAMGRFAERANVKGLNISCVDVEPITLKGDPKLIGRILDQLLDNAVKFTAEGAVTLSARVVEDRCELMVSDTGSGMDSERFHELLSAWTQADGTHTRAHGGLGLGLGLANKLANDIGGYIEAQSDRTNGSCVWLALPVVSDEPDSNAINEVALMDMKSQFGEVFADLCNAMIDDTSADLAKLEQALETGESEGASICIREISARLAPIAEQHFLEQSSSACQSLEAEDACIAGERPAAVRKFLEATMAALQELAAEFEETD